MGIKSAMIRSAVLFGVTMLGTAGCANSTTGSANGHPIGYRDTPPAVTPANANAPGTPEVSGPSEQLPPGGMTVPPPAQTPPDGAK